MSERLQEELSDASAVPSEQAVESQYVFRAVVSRYETALLRYVGQIQGSCCLADAEDIVQETFLRLHRQVAENGEASVRKMSSWLFRVAHNLAMDAIRKQGREGRKRERAAQAEGGADKVDALGGMMQREASERALAELHKLPDEQRHVILLRIIQGMTFREIGQVTGLTVGNVSYRINQGLQELARRLKASGVI